MSPPRSGCVAAILAAPGLAPCAPFALSDLGGKALIQRVVERARAASLVDETVVLVAQDAASDPLAAFLEAHAIACLRVPAGDVLGGLLALVDEHDPSFVACLDGDRPFLDFDHLDLRLGALRAFDADLVHLAGAASGALEGTLGGLATTSARALGLAQASDDPRDRTLGGALFLARHAQALESVEIEVDARLARPGLSLAVRSGADLELARAVWAAVDHERDGLFPLGRALRWIESHALVPGLAGDA